MTCFKKFKVSKTNVFEIEKWNINYCNCRGYFTIEYSIIVLNDRVKKLPVWKFIRFKF